ncbi:hypothetical protein HYV50_04845 [Candidatus Pacearchaeota archaeon]|nr:hypothetical protein [Candidatus Pacearchaeota archaeon]
MKKEAMIFIICSVLVSTILPPAESKQIPTTASVQVNRIYALSLDINILNKKISPGENLSVFMDLNKSDLSNIKNEIEVDLNYEIIRRGEIIEEGFLKLINITNEKEEILTIPISQDLKGAYSLKIIASNPQSYTSEDKDKFVVKGKSETPSFLKYDFLFLLKNKMPFYKFVY